jgi:hypothetical protein
VKGGCTREGGCGEHTLSADGTEPAFGFPLPLCRRGATNGGHRRHRGGVVVCHTVAIGAVEDVGSLVTGVEMLGTVVFQPEWLRPF